MANCPNWAYDYCSFLDRITPGREVGKRGFPMQKLTIAAIALAAALALTACSGPGQAVTVGNAPKTTKSAVPIERGAKSVLTTSQATAALPTLAQVGAAWADGKSAASSGSDTSASAKPTFTPATCSFSATNGATADLAVVAATTKPVAEAQGDFHKPPPADDTLGLAVHSLTVNVKSYKDDADAKRLDAIATRLKDCATFTSSDPTTGITANWQITPVSLPNYGDKTLAFRMQGAVSFLIFLVDSVQIVAGHNVITIFQSGVGSIDTELAGNVAKAIMANLDTATK